MSNRFTGLSLAAMMLAAGYAGTSAQTTTGFPVYDFTPEDCVKTQPEGELRVYERSGENMSAFLGGISDGLQSGQKLEIVLDDDGKTIWFYNIVSTAGDCFSWVKGEINGDKITIPAGQLLYIYDLGSYYNAYVLCNIGENNDPDASAYDVYECIPGDIELSYEDGVIRLLPNPSGIAAIGLQRYSTDEFIMENGLNYKWLGYGDINSVYTPFDETPSVGPADNLPVEKYAFTYTNSVGGNISGHIVDVAIDNDTFFIRGISQTDACDYWAKGEIKGNDLIFPDKQYLGVQRVNYSDHFMYLCSATTKEINGYLFADFAPETRFEWDKATKTAVSDGILMMNSGDDMVFYSGIWFDMKLTPYVEKPAVPANPKIGADYSHDPDWGMTQVIVEIPCVDTEGNYIDTQYLSYRMYVNGEPFTFTPTDYEYFDLEKPMEEIPYDFSSYDINMLQPGIWAVTFYGEEPSSIGVQSVSRSGGETNMSDIMTYHTSGIDQLNPESSPVEIKYHNMSGVEVPADYKGIILRTERYADGSVRTFKQFNR